MDLTRIRVRGKRKAPLTNIPSALQVQPIRSMKAQRRSLAAVMRDRSLRPQPRLDALPDEILESIFLYSANLSLPRASGLVGKKLSARATLLRLIIWAFDDTWAQWFGVCADPAVLHGPWLEDATHLLSNGDPVLQSEVLAQPWISINLLLQAQQSWADKNAHGLWYQHSTMPLHEPDDAGDEHQHDFAGGFSHFDSRRCFEADYRQALRLPPYSFQPPRWSLQDIHPETRIPARLITGPWDDESQRRLLWLCRGGFRPSSSEDDSSSSLGWEIKLDLLRNAILHAAEPNVLVANCLITGWAFSHLPADAVRAELVGLERRLEWGGDAPVARELLRRTRNALYLCLNLPDSTY